MIRIALGRIGSGKTLMEVREMMKPQNRRIKTYTNILTKDMDHVILLKPEMLFTKEVIGHKKDGTEKLKLHVNIDFWKAQPKPLNIVLDEAHALIDARRSTSGLNKVMNDWLSIIRRTIGGGGTRAGYLVLISQLPNRLDCVYREMANKVTYHICSWIASCPKCGFSQWTSSEAIDPLDTCPFCFEDMNFSGHFIDTYHFSTMDLYWAWHLSGDRHYSKVERTTGVSEIFSKYDTLQWDNLLVKV